MKKIPNKWWKKLMDKKLSLAPVCKTNTCFEFEVPIDFAQRRDDVNALCGVTKSLKDDKCN